MLQNNCKILQKICSQQPLGLFSNQLNVLNSTAGIRSPERLFSELSTVEDKFGEIGGDIGRTRNRAAFWRSRRSIEERWSHGSISRVSVAARPGRNRRM